MRKYRSLFGRPLTHPDIAHIEALIEDKQRSARAIDKFYERKYKHASTTGIGHEVRDKQPRAVPTLHDLAQNNPVLRDMLRKMQQ